MSDGENEGNQRTVAYSAFDPNSNQSKTLYSPNHAHPLKLMFAHQAWNCDGNTVFGRCRGEGRLTNAKRYKCTVCANFDLCQYCVQ